MASDLDGEREANAKRLQDAVQELRHHLQFRKFGDFWKQVKTISAMFRSLGPLAKDDRERLWSEFGELCQEAKGLQQQTRDQLNDVSKQKRALVERKLDEAYYQTKGATSAADLKTASALLAEGLSWMKPGWSQVGVLDDLISLNDGRMTSDDREACWERYLEVRETLDWKYKEFKQAWAERQDQERSRRVDRIDKAKAVIRRIEAQIDDLEYKRRDARTSEFADRIQGWIDEKRNKIRDIENSIARDEDVIADIDRRSG